MNRPFLVSVDALRRLTGTERYTREALGPQALRGRVAPVEVFAMSDSAAVNANLAS